MTDRKKIISLARECGFGDYYGTDSPEFIEMLEAFYHRVQREAFELAALVCENCTLPDTKTETEWVINLTHKPTRQGCAEAIRQLIKE